MTLFNSYFCPNCNNLFSFLIRPSLRINRGLLAPYLKCPSCNQICQQKVNFSTAIWIWPLSIFIFVALIYIFKTLFFHQFPILYIAVVIVSFFVLFIGFRYGLKLVKVKDSAVKRSSSYKWLMPVIGLVLFALIIGYYTHDWLNVIIGITIGFIVWIFFIILLKR